jgi:hypothetical protein
MPMERIGIGAIRVGVQNEPERNEDVYRISGEDFGDMAGRNEIWNWIVDKIEDPERFVVNEEEVVYYVYTKQPDAAIELALSLNYFSSWKTNNFTLKLLGGCS